MTCPAYTKCSRPVVLGGQISVTFYNLTAGQGIIITYSNVTAPGFATVSTFDASVSLPATKSVITLDPSPQVTVTCADGTGTMTVSPSRVAASSTSTLTFTFTPSDGCGVEGGAVSLIVPPGWTPPLAVPGSAGDATSSLGSQSLSVSGMAITVTGVTLAAGQALNITYSKARTPGAATTSTFAVSEQSASAGTLTALLSYPVVAVLPPVVTGSPAPSVTKGSSSPATTGPTTSASPTTSAGTGTMTVSPGTVSASHPGMLTFIYRAAASGLAPSGEVTLTVPPGWTPPTAAPGMAGFTTSRPGALSISGSRITVTGVTLGPGQALTITYRPTTAPRTASVSVFATAERPTAASGLNALAISPSVTVTGLSPFHIPVQLALVLLAAGCAAAVSAIRFLRHRPQPVLTPVVRAVPHGGTPGTVGVQRGGTGATHAVSIEPHPVAAVTTLEEMRP